MAQIHESYVCKCDVPRLQRHLGQDTGICGICNLVYDPNLYEMRLREHVSGYTYESLHDFLRDNDPHYKALTD